eukprot:2989489-Rhodomonas_salina.2
MQYSTLPLALAPKSLRRYCCQCASGTKNTTRDQPSPTLLSPDPSWLCLREARGSGGIMYIIRVMGRVKGGGERCSTGRRPIPNGGRVRSQHCTGPLTIWRCGCD